MRPLMVHVMRNVTINNKLADIIVMMAVFGDAW